MMIVNDKREHTRKGILFSEINVGAVYEDKDGVICIKTSHTDPETQTNCISFVGNLWREDEEQMDSTVYPIICELTLKRDC